jgi:hypothetical protein
VQRLLENEKYTGTRVFGGRTGGRHARLKDGAAAVIEAGGASAKGDVLRVAACPAIVPLELFLAVAARLANGRKNGRKKGVPVTPLAGLCRCGACGAAMHSCRKGSLLYLVCSRRREEGKDTCPTSNYARGDEVFSRVVATLADRLLQGDTVARLVELAGQAEDEARARWEAAVRSARKAVESCNGRLATARRRLAEAPDDLVEDYQRLVRELKEEMAGLEADLKRLPAEQPAQEGGDAELLTRWLSSCRSLCRETPADPERQNAVLRELVAEVRVHPPARVVRRKQTVGKIEVVLPEWLSRVLATTAIPASSPFRGFRESHPPGDPRSRHAVDRHTA